MLNFSFFSCRISQFYNCLYGLLYRFADPSSVEHLPLLLQCLHLMFHETKQLSIERVASFVKRLASLSLYLPPYAALATLHALRLILNKYPKSKALLDREATASGLHLAEIDDPDLANSFAGTLWELGLQKANYHPFLPVYAQSILDDESLPLALARTTPLQLFENYDASEGGFNPPLPLPQMFTAASTGSGSSAPTSASMRKKLDLKRRIQMAALSASRTNERLQSTFLKQCTEQARKRPRDGAGSEEQQQSSLPQLAERLKGLKNISALYRKHRSQQQQQQQRKKTTAQPQQPKSNGRAATVAASSQPKAKSQKAKPQQR